MNNNPVQDDPTCAVCYARCSKALGAHRKTTNTFWGGQHGTKEFFTDERTFYFCTEEHRNKFFWPDDFASGELVP